MIFPDSHFHLLSLKERGIILDPNEKLFGIDIGTTATDFIERKPLIEEFKLNYSLGCGPWCVAKDDDINAMLTKLESFIKTTKPVAIGEIGLDYYWNYGTKELQRELFLAQIDLANKYSLPIIIHSRDADDEMMEILESTIINKGGIMHCFSSHSLEFAKKAISKGFYISFSGNVTYKNNKALQEVAKQIPLDKLLLETDSPYLAPQKVRGKINRPEYVKYVYEFVATLKEIELEPFCEQIISNLEEFYTRSQAHRHFEEN